jgi:hypothetical protein
MSDHYNLLEPAINILSKLIEKYKLTENIEIEIRIGRYEDNKFTSGLNSEEFYKKIYNCLKTYKKWINVEYSKSKEYINNNYKKVNKVITKKTKLEIHDFNFIGTPYDFRICVSKEEAVNNSNFKSDFIRNKSRYSFVYKECKFDLTKVEEEYDDEVLENEEFEIELINLNSQTSDKYRAHSALLKIFDIINICEPIDISKVKLLKK